MQNVIFEARWASHCAANMAYEFCLYLESSARLLMSVKMRIVIFTRLSGSAWSCYVHIIIIVSVEPGYDILTIQELRCQMLHVNARVPITIHAKCSERCHMVLV